jgi:anti-sigma factor RsiW
MIDEQLEFLISQYADGSLPESERALVDLRLQTDADARALLEEYRSLDATLKAAMPLPAVNWDRLAEHLSDAVAAKRDEAQTADVWGRIGFGVRLAIAACVLLTAAGLAVWTAMRSAQPENVTVAHNSGGNDPAANPAHVTANPDVVPEQRPAPVVIVRGPAAQAAEAAPVVVVSVGPSSDVTPNWRAAEGVVTGPSRAIWIASSYDGAQDTQRLPY